MKYRVNKEKCISCGVCLRNCPGATKLGESDKAEIVDQEKLEECGGESVCPIGAIEKIDKEGKTETEIKPEFTPRQGKGFGMGKGRGLGLGPRNGKGKGRGGGGRRK